MRARNASGKEAGSIANEFRISLEAEGGRRPRETSESSNSGSEPAKREHPSAPSNIKLNYQQSTMGFFGSKKLNAEDHERSITLARRLSRMNEADLLQEPYYETNFEKQHFNHDFCKELSSHLVHLRNLPVQCKKYKDVVDDLKKRDVDDTANTADMS